MSGRRADVVTVTLNPAIDQTIRLDRLVPGSVHRARAVRRDAGGKGVNVASCLADWGVAVGATGFLGAGNADLFEALFARKAIGDGFLRLAGETRTNVKIVDDRDTTDINLPGLSVDEASLGALTEAVGRIAAPGACVLLAGSLPVGLPAESYRRLSTALAGAGYRILLDTSGAALDAALADGATLPLAIKPNRHELETHAGRALATLDAVAEAAEALRARGIAYVVVSLGEEGALFAGPGGRRLARLPANPVSTVGAGDAMVAGILAGLVAGADIERLARLGTAFAVGKLGLDGPHLPSRDAIERLAAAVAITII